MRRSNSSVIMANDYNAGPGSQQNAKKQQPDYVGNVFWLALHLVIIIWQCSVMHSYAAQWPAAIINGHHVGGLSDSCSKLFEVMHWTIFIHILHGVGALTLFILAVVAKDFPSVNKLCCPSICISYGIEIGCSIAVLVANIWGLVVLIQVGGNTTSACNDMYNCAWWTYLGFLLVSLAVGVCFLCCLAGAVVLVAGTSSQQSYGSV